MRKIILSFTLLLVALACVVPSAIAPAEPPQETADMTLLQTFIVQTAGAAQTQTAIANPSLTPTHTATPTRIPTITPSPTVTFIYLLPTLTLVPTSTQLLVPIGGGGANGTPKSPSFKTPQPWACLVIEAETQPPKGAVLQKKQEFYAYWTIRNTGTKTWTRTTIDLVYKGGYRHDGTKIIDITENGGPGSTVRVGTRFTAPKTAGEYQSFFVLKVGSTTFCSMKISFVIKD
ncbi:MAG: hypothetical protein UZ14_CFX002000655 [Chloroflexi bacterium OLB14]|nr:MAG: hypothetical protein UZ14_CFX002000655 [Chloroflexi bacterium OLB14]